MEIKRAVAYCRFSSDNQRVESIDAQVRAIKEYCKKNKYILEHIYKDEAQSGTNDDREQFQQMIVDSQNRSFDYVIVHKLDRFARDRYDSAIYKKKLRDNDIQVKSVLENLDNSPEAIILESVLEGMSEYYSKNLSREVKKGLNENALKAVHNGGVPPLGFDVNENKQYVLNDKEANAVRLIFKLYTQNYGYALIAEELNKHGYLTKYGFPFGKNSIRDILSNEKYRGCYVWNKRKSKKTGNRIYKNDEDIIKIEGAMPRIIDDNTFYKAQELLAGKVKPRQNKKHEYILTGFLECGHCGYSYCGGQSNKLKDGTMVYRYACTNKKNKLGCSATSIKANDLENFVLKTIKEQFLTDKAIVMLSTKIKEYIDAHFKPDNSAINAIKKDISRLKKQQDRILDLYLDQEINKDMLSSKTKKIENELILLNNKLVEEEINKNLIFNEKDIVEFLIKTRENLETDNAQNKRMLIEAFLYKILIYDDHILVKLRYDKVFSECTNIGGGEGNRTPVQK